MPLPKRLIEVDLPIRRISAHARRENTVRHGHFKTLHMWWARRPLAACRAVICASLWPDPADPLCPDSFRLAARALLNKWTPHDRHLLLGSESQERFKSAQRNPAFFENNLELRGALLDFLADFADWDRSGSAIFLETARAITQAAHESLGGAKGSHARVFDPFAGGGSIPLEALRLGTESCASDLNPVAVLLNRMALDCIPRHGQRLADAVRESGARIKDAATQRLQAYYPADVDHQTPITYIWSRTILSEAPDQAGDGIPVEVPLLRGFWLAKKKGRFQALRWVRDADGRVMTDPAEVEYADGTRVRVRRPRLEIFSPKSEADLPPPTVKRGSATCPVTGYTTPVARVRAQLKKRRGGADDARLLAVALLHPSRGGRGYRLATPKDEEAVALARKETVKLRLDSEHGISTIPDEPLDVRGIRHTWAMIYGLQNWGDLYSSRQLVALTTLRRLIDLECTRTSFSFAPRRGLQTFGRVFG